VTCSFAALNSAFVFHTPKMPGEPMRVQPSRARRSTSENE
jgi:hypothetical protein